MYAVKGGNDTTTKTAGRRLICSDLTQGLYHALKPTPFHRSSINRSTSFCCSASHDEKSDSFISPRFTIHLRLTASFRNALNASPIAAAFSNAPFQRGIPCRSFRTGSWRFHSILFPNPLQSQSAVPQRAGLVIINFARSILLPEARFVRFPDNDAGRSENSRRTGCRIWNCKRKVEKGCCIRNWKQHLSIFN